ncbi:non-hydrolyzing UDP-N-acetylglucosamine 2-epimerase [Desulforamulus hydrothermalis]|uniref:UDP-N-acetylglucosamine 2-epimerase (non-hydrolyzing) n=1 Tax=Desulforamulus hydrothermalis Lam5 = DSM 18033 TaxID=1121428 RepID=K8EIJ8_9FIRM|nr:UDP-N-acetylglucosamine 2-epimerase (non-hydrolyzing) [Desulforamulus hydrothermalis]CCO08426.1 putative UDP-N-acetylglucosamine 2-epimerase [Desulforamulus hydrothermalis Lam5 = DSM 18033]SHH15178.1 UDP-N-acetylglucosamine 2-epimerase (non-hydrolysing) [Desulforamulus hydrothermalis Lam5 = DSM 18033]
MLKILTVFGTRPEAVKMAPLVQELNRRPDQIRSLVAVTAQHREMLDQVLQLFDIQPDYDLNIMQQGQTLYDVTVRALEGLKEVLIKSNPDLVLVHGDTTTTFVAALAAYYRQIPVGHVEAGLRTHNKYSPFPEEMNRHLTGALAEYHFAPTQQAMQNLLKENVNPDNIFVTGNTVIDALKATVKENYVFTDPLLNKIDFGRQRVLLVTTHRRENLGQPMREIYLALKEIAETYPDVAVVFPVHKNPAVRRVALEILGHLPRVHLIEPLQYEPFINLMQRCHLVLTDSGGLQEEAPALGKPVLVLRHTTERPEAVAAGTVKLVGTEREVVLAVTKQLLDNPQAYRAMAEAVNPYGDGQASRRIVDFLCYKFHLADRPPEEFWPQK